jgi:hypothetical protein
MQITHRNNVDEIAFTLPASAADGLSEIIDLGAARASALQMPITWTTASLTVQASADGVTFGDVFKAGSELTLDADAGRVLLLGTDLVGLQFLRFRSGTSLTPIQQEADRTLKLICHSRL